MKTNITPASKVSSCLLALLTLGAVWFGPGADGQRAAAAIFPPQGDDSMSSMGVFRIVVAPAFRPLLAPAVALNGYPGYSSLDGRVTSPLLIDNMTVVGRSSPHNRPLVGSVPVGVPSMGNVGYGDYLITPAIFAGAPAGTREILTRIRSFALESIGQRGCSNADPRLPQVPINHRMVYAGPGQGVARPSIGMVQERIPNGAADPDFPALSFFDIFVEVNLPAVPTTVSQGAFPGTGAVLYNDSPLVITNLDLSSLPPTVVYIHGETTAVPLKFRDPNPPHWLANDVFGYLVLAGHGTRIDCNNEPATTAFLDTVLGPIGTSANEMPIEWPLPGDRCPWPGTTYDSVRDVDTIQFTAPGIVLQARNFIHYDLDNPIPLPPLLGGAVYADADTNVRLEYSFNGQPWEPLGGSGATTVRVQHTADQGPTQIFETEMVQLDLVGNTPLGPFILRESPTRQSLGRHTVRKTPQAFMTSSFFDVFLELSINGGQTWNPANRPIRVQLGNPPCGAAGAQLTVRHQGSAGQIPAVVLIWSDPSYRVQCRNSLNPGAPWVDVPGASPLVQTIPPGQNRFYRLACQ